MSPKAHTWKAWSYRMIVLTGPPLLSAKMKKRQRANTMLDEGFHERAAMAL